MLHCISTNICSAEESTESIDCLLLMVYSEGSGIGGELGWVVQPRAKFRETA